MIKSFQTINFITNYPKTTAMTKQHVIMFVDIVFYLPFKYQIGAFYGWDITNYVSWQNKKQRKTFMAFDITANNKT